MTQEIKNVKLSNFHSALKRLWIYHLQLYLRFLTRAFYTSVFIRRFHYPSSGIGQTDIVFVCTSYLFVIIIIVIPEQQLQFLACRSYGGRINRAKFEVYCAGSREL